MKGVSSCVEQYFHLSTRQKEQFDSLDSLYRAWNDKINVISRKDIDNLALRHVLHSLAVAQLTQFVPRTEILDLGTGGGFPGIPLSILFPEVHFTLIDGTKKKLKVVEAIVQDINLDNVVVMHKRIEEIEKGRKFDFITARAVTSMDRLIQWTRPRIKTEMKNGLPNGLFAFKGGDLRTEKKMIPPNIYREIHEIKNFFDYEIFKEKYLLYLQY